MSSSSLQSAPVLLEPGQYTVRKAAMRDIHALLQLINNYAAQGIMLPRTELEMSANIRDFTVVYSGGRLLGCGALHFYSPVSAEIRSLAVAPDAKAHGLGKLLVRSLEQEGILNDLHVVFAFTYVPDFFCKLGFLGVDRGLLPLKVWKDCWRCPKFQCCDEVAVMKALVPGAQLQLAPEPDLGLVQLPRPANRKIG